MNNRGGLNLGDEIRNIVQDAVNNMDFNRLNRDIKYVVNGALDEVRRSIAGRHGNNQTWNNKSWKGDDYQYSNNSSSQTWNFNNQQSYQTNKPVPKSDKITVSVGKVSGVLFTVFGSIISAISLVASIVLSIIGYTLGISVMYKIIAFILLPSFMAGMVLLFNGRRISNRLKRFQRYIAQMHDLKYFMIKDFSSATGRSNKFIAKDLQKMIEIGMFLKDILMRNRPVLC